MFSVTDALSPCALPADPLKLGLVLFVNGAAGVSVTDGRVVSTVNDTGLLLPSGFPNALAWVATAWYSPSERGALASEELHAPPVPAAVAVATSASEEL